MDDDEGDDVYDVYGDVEMCGEKFIPLFAAIKIKNKYIRNKIVKSLLDNDANVNIIGNEGHTPLHRLVLRGLHKNPNYINTIRILVDNEANILCFIRRGSFSRLFILS